MALPSQHSQYNQPSMNLMHLPSSLNVGYQPPPVLSQQSTNAFLTGQLEQTEFISEPGLVNYSLPHQSTSHAGASHNSSHSSFANHAEHSDHQSESYSERDQLCGQESESKGSCAAASVNQAATPKSNAVGIFSDPSSNFYLLEQYVQPIYEDFVYLTESVLLKTMKSANKQLQDTLMNYFLENHVSNLIIKEMNCISKRAVRYEIEKSMSKTKSAKYMNLLNAFESKVRLFQKEKSYESLLMQLITDENSSAKSSEQWKTLVRKRILALLLIVHWRTPRAEDIFSDFFAIWDLIFPNYPLPQKLKKATKFLAATKQMKRTKPKIIDQMELSQTSLSQPSLAINPPNFQTQQLAGSNLSFQKSQPLPQSKQKQQSNNNYSSTSQTQKSDTGYNHSYPQTNNYAAAAVVASTPQRQHSQQSSYAESEQQASNSYYETSSLKSSAAWAQMQGEQYHYPPESTSPASQQFQVTPAGSQQPQTYQQQQQGNFDPYLQVPATQSRQQGPHKLKGRMRSQSWDDLSLKREEEAINPSQQTGVVATTPTGNLRTPSYQVEQSRQMQQQRYDSQFQQQNSIARNVSSQSVLQDQQAQFYNQQPYNQQNQSSNRTYYAQYSSAIPSTNQPIGGFTDQQKQSQQQSQPQQIPLYSEYYNRPQQQAQQNSMISSANSMESSSNSNANYFPDQILLRDTVSPKESNTNSNTTTANNNQYYSQQLPLRPESYLYENPQQIQSDSSYLPRLSSNQQQLNTHQQRTPQIPPSSNQASASTLATTAKLTYQPTQPTVLSNPPYYQQPQSHLEIHQQQSTADQSQPFPPHQQTTAQAKEEELQENAKQLPQQRSLLTSPDSPSDPSTTDSLKPNNNQLIPIKIELSKDQDPSEKSMPSYYGTTHAPNSQQEDETASDLPQLLQLPYSPCNRANQEYQILVSNLPENPSYYCNTNNNYDALNMPMHIIEEIKQTRNFKRQNTDLSGMSIESDKMPFKRSDTRNLTGMSNFSIESDKDVKTSTMMSRSKFFLKHQSSLELPPVVGVRTTKRTGTNISTCNNELEGYGQNSLNFPKRSNFKKFSGISQISLEGEPNYNNYMQIMESGFPAQNFGNITRSQMRKRTNLSVDSLASYNIKQERDLQNLSYDFENLSIHQTDNLPGQESLNVDNSNILADLKDSPMYSFAPYSTPNPNIHG